MNDKLKKLERIAEILDAQTDNAEALVLLERLLDLELKLTELEARPFDLTTQGKIEGFLNDLSNSLNEIKLNDKTQELEAKISQLLAEHRKLNKDKDYSDDYFNKEIQTLKNVIADIKAIKPQEINVNSIIQEVYQTVKDEVVKLIPEAKEVSPETIIEQIEERQLDVSAIKGLQELVEKLTKDQKKTIIGANKPLSGLLDVDVAGIAVNQSIRWDGIKWVAYTPGSGGASAFTSLTDTPSSYTGQGGKIVKVKGTEDGLEFDVATDTDEKVKLNASDPTAGYLDDKITGYGFITDISGQDLSTADNTTSQFITLADVPAEADTLQSVTDRGATTTEDITANSFITDGGASTDFVKGDGSLDSSTYLTSESDPVWTSEKGDYFNTTTDDTDDITDTADNRFTNDTDITRLENTSGTNTGDQDLSGYELLDGTNQPATGNKNIAKADPEHRLTDTGNDEYTRITKSDTQNEAVRYNKVIQPAAGVTGGTITYDGDYVIHTFTSSGNFVVTGNINVEVLVVGGGGGGGVSSSETPGGGGGAGGLIHNTSLTLSTGTYNVVIGAGGLAGTWEGDLTGSNGENSSFGTIIAIGGGGGGGRHLNGNAGGSGGGGGAHYFGDAPLGGVGTAGQGNNGGKGYVVASAGRHAGGGGGAGAVGQDGTTSKGGNGGAGLSISITGSAITYAGGGGGGGETAIGTGGAGGGGNGARISSAGNGTNGLGGGGGGAANHPLAPGNGGSGVVIIRYLPTGSSFETRVWKSTDGVLPSEKGIQTFGDENGRTVIEGLTTRFNLAGVEKEQINSSGHTHLDNWKLLFGTADDASISYDGTNLLVNPKEVGAGLFKVDGGAVFNESGADVDFRIEGDTNANLFYVDAGNNRVGIGTATPTYNLHVYDTVVGGTLGIVENTHSGGFANVRQVNNEGKLNQFGIYGSARAAYGAVGPGEANVYTNTVGLTIMSDNANGIIKFSTGGNAEKVRIDKSGNVGIGTTTPGAKLSLGGVADGADAERIRFNRSDANRYNSIYSLATSSNDTNSTISFRVHNGSSATAQTTVMTLKGDGNVLLPGDSRKLIFGTGNDASITYDGTNLLINPQEVGSGATVFTGNVRISTYTSNGFLKTSNSDGTLSVDTSSYLNLSQVTPQTISGGIPYFFNGIKTASIYDEDGVEVISPVDKSYFVNTLYNETENGDIIFKVNDGGTTRTAIQVHGDEGSVSFPRQNGFHAYLSSDQVIAASTNTIVVFDTEIFDTLGEYNNATGVYKAKVPGIYLISVNLTWLNLVNATFYATAIHLNASTIARNEFWANNGNLTLYAETLSILYPLDKDDEITISVFQNYAGNRTVRSANRNTNFSIIKVA